MVFSTLLTLALGVLSCIPGLLLTRASAPAPGLRAAAAPQSFLVLGAGETVLGQTDQFVASPRLRGLYEPADQQARRLGSGRPVAA